MPWVHRTTGILNRPNVQYLFSWIVCFSFHPLSCYFNTAWQQKFAGSSKSAVLPVKKYTTYSRWRLPEILFFFCSFYTYIFQNEGGGGDDLNLIIVWRRQTEWKNVYTCVAMYAQTTTKHTYRLQSISDWLYVYILWSVAGYISWVFSYFCCMWVCVFLFWWAPTIRLLPVSEYKCSWFGVYALRATTMTVIHSVQYSSSTESVRFSLAQTIVVSAVPFSPPLENNETKELFEQTNFCSLVRVVRTRVGCWPTSPPFKFHGHETYDFDGEQKCYLTNVIFSELLCLLTVIFVCS